MAGDERKQSLYFPRHFITELREEADRLDRSFSWVVQQAWKMSRKRIKALPTQKVEE